MGSRGSYVAVTFATLNIGLTYKVADLPEKRTLNSIRATTRHLRVSVTTSCFHEWQVTMLQDIDPSCPRSFPNQKDTDPSFLR